MGLPVASALEERLGRSLAAAAVVWMLAVAAWGINGHFGDGHFASTAAAAVAGDNMWRYRILYPVLSYADSLGSANSYLHHPLGVFWVAALAEKVFGPHDWAARLPAVVYSTLTPLFVYRFGRAAWGPIEGALAAWAYVSLPITLGFSSFHALEGPVIAGIAVASWGYARFSQTWRARYAATSLLGFLWAVNHDWPGYVWGALFVGWLFLRAFVLPAKLVGEVRTRALGCYVGLMVGAALLSLVAFGALLMHTNKLNELLVMYNVRSGGNAIPVSTMLTARHVWIQMMFPAVAIVIGKLAVPVVAGRFAWRRHDLELFPLIILLTAGFQYVHFKQGADVHIFWPQYFALYFALAVGALTASLRAAASWLARRGAPRLRTFFARHGRWLAPTLVALPVLAVLRDGAWMIRLAQESSGRFVSPTIKSDIDRVEAMTWWAARLPATDKIGFHPGITPVHWGLGWELRPHVLVRDQHVGAPGASPRAYALDSRFAEAADLRQAVRSFHVDAVGCFWFIDRAAPPTPLAGYSFEEREPGPIDWYLRGGTEPVRTVRADPWVTWEWRALLGQSAPMPTAAPVTAEQVRIAHNAAVVNSDAAAAARHRSALAKVLDAKPTAKFENGTELIGAVHGRRAERAMTLYFLTGPKGMPANLKFSASAQVTKRMPLSTLPLDPAVIEVGLPPTIPTELWLPGHIYSVKFTYRHRPGRERLFGNFVSTRGVPGPALLGGAKSVELAVL